MALRTLFLTWCVVGPGVDALPTALVTGATGQTGVAIYKRLKSVGGFDVRAFVRNATKAKSILGCDKCDESEGVFVGDLNDKASVANAMKNVDVLAIVTAAVLDCSGPISPTPPFEPCKYHKGAFPIDIDWEGTKTQIKALASSGGPLASKQVAFVSSRDTWNPNSTYGNLANGHMSFYKLNAEAFIMSSGVPYTIVKPCGLGDGPPGQYKLVTGHDGGGYDQKKDNLIDRSDVARVLVEALRNPAASLGLRFELCSEDVGTPTADADIVKDVLKPARYPWDPRVEQEARAFVV